MVRTAGLAMLAMLVAAPAATASTVSVRNSVVAYDGDAAADTVSIQRYVNEDNNRLYYLVTDDTGLTAGTGCFKVSGPMGACRITAGQRYDLRTGAGDDRVEIVGDDTPGGSTDLGAGTDRFTGRAAADAVHGGDGDDIIRGGAGNDALVGDGGADQVAGDAGNDAIDGGAGDDQLEFGGAAIPAGVGGGADDLHGGAGKDRLSYNDRAAGVSLTLDGRPGDGPAGEADNVHDDVETIVGTALDDVLIGSDRGQELFGNAGLDRVDGLGGSDLVNGGTGDDELFGGAGDDRIEGSAGEDYLEGGAGADFFAGDNPCTAEPCTGGSDFIQARDGEADTVNCGVGADTALVDAIDVVAQDTQHGCERIDRPAGSVAPPASEVLGATVSGPKLKVVGVRRLSTLRRGKLRVEVTCPASCRVKARLISGRTVVASASRTRLGAGLQVVRPKTSRRGRRLLKRRTKVGMTLVVDVRDDQGRTTTLTQVLRFRR